MRQLTDEERAAEARAIEARYKLPAGSVTIEQRGAAGRPRRYPDEHVASVVSGAAAGNRREAARLLGVSESTVRDALARLAAARPDEAPAGASGKATRARK